jgi:hypothetical protein
MPTLFFFVYTSIVYTNEHSLLPDRLYDWYAEKNLLIIAESEYAMRTHSMEEIEER